MPHPDEIAGTKYHSFSHRLKIYKPSPKAFKTFSSFCIWMVSFPFSKSEMKRVPTEASPARTACETCCSFRFVLISAPISAAVCNFTFDILPPSFLLPNGNNLVLILYSSSLHSRSGIFFTIYLQGETGGSKGVPPLTRPRRPCYPMLFN